MTHQLLERASTAGSAISSLSSKQVPCVETMVAGVCLTWKSQSTNLLGDTSGDRAKYVDFLGSKFLSLHLKIGVYLLFLLCVEEACANISLLY